MNIETVKELIASLESAGELSIREQKFLKLAKAFKQLATENVALKESRNNLAEFIHEELDADYPLNMNLETHATDRIVAEAEARGVEKAIAHLEKKFSNIGVQIMNLQWLADSLREGADK
ncbi:hypothetical protein ACKLLD_04070 [Klebsiella pneumoniae]|uniref:hypothetical protein n=1 Tax=Klebsiella pneumoniae TaxID=573 RepID=UPI000B40BB61|nr:hypothetical protein [Klebsiella pneumoniae]MDZ3509026.1 hypothetical protein [Klebsiella pneumoniae]MDZ3551863.1 hypothetical protein [Klebsiella pneumoniae]OVT59111.1 hypothetical protein BME88_19585 [Klebsiella pneumoniae]OVY37782.1 hypothetical protein BME71_20675 [Klebsiella pneumoniae]HBY8505973.1 hypothetical protein [Klebsiella pneumoniae]